MPVGATGLDVNWGTESFMVSFGLPGAGPMLVAAGRGDETVPRWVLVIVSRGTLLVTASEAIMTRDVSTRVTTVSTDTTRHAPALCFLISV